MKCTIFSAPWGEAQVEFNKWAHGKDLTRDVIIHEHIVYMHDELSEDELMIIVYHPDTPAWNAIKPETKEYTEVELVPKHKIVEEQNLT